ncbi:hypothetical protein FOZ60_010239 [Perkinsus olseni]|uniref:Cathepsin propeptide inhibitor domain-containing protein n=1 Tax=Perkinsus olseni TaxID=32597 RepID=A0A7J6NFR8_PEROL|nr:hypothetical protein FOZ60_010239 [Perkinsus olseni]
MKPLVFAVLLVQQCLADSFADRADSEFDNFKKKFNVQYTPSEEEYRRQVFHDNFKWIEEQNARGHPHVSVACFHHSGDACV